MAKVTEILANKGSSVLSIGPEATVLDASLVMNEHKIGSVVVSEHGQLVGIFTERDVLQRVVADRKDPAATRVAEVMSADVVCCTPETTIDEARTAMMNRRVRHLPVVDKDGKILGVISIGDFNAWQLTGQERTIHLLHDYMHGRV